MSSMPRINSVLVEDARERCCGCMKEFLARIKAILECRRNAKRGKKYRADLGMDVWDGFTWAEQRQHDGRRVERAWNYLKMEWTVVPSLVLERSVSPCRVRWVVMAEDEEEEELGVGVGVGVGVREKDIKEGQNREKFLSYNSFYAAPAPASSSDEVNYVEESMSEHSQRITSRETPIEERRLESDIDVTAHLSDILDEHFTELTRSTGPFTNKRWEVPRANARATGEDSSIGRHGIWKAITRLAVRKTWKRIEFRKPGSSRPLGHADSHSESGGTTHLASLEGQNLPANPSEPELDGLAKLIGSIGDMRVNPVRHIWHTETGHWTHERTENR